MWFRAFRGRLEKAQRFLAFHYPLTLSGSVLCGLCLYVLGTAFATRNPYGFVLSAAGLFTLGVLVALGRVQARRFDGAETIWDSSAPLFARVRGIRHRLAAPGVRTLPFYRLHFCLAGPVAVGRQAVQRFWLDTPGRGGGEIPLYFPLCGVFHASAHLKVKDIFGLTRSRFGSSWQRQLAIRPALLPDREFFQIEALDGLEEKTKVKQSDIERYFMREYIPGDRVRDINWKASSRLQELVTRIAPVTQEKTQVITVLFRAIRRDGRETVQSIGHLNYVKSWFLLFLKVLKKQRSELQFRVVVGGLVRELESEEDIAKFAEELSGVFFEPPPVPGGWFVPGAGASGAQSTGDFFVFSTPYDETLAADLSLMTMGRVHLFRTGFAEKASDGKADASVRLFPDWAHLLYPSGWFLRRDRPRKAPSLTVSGRTEEAALEVKLV